MGFFALLQLNHMLHRLCGPSFLSFNLAVDTPEPECNALAAALSPEGPNTSASFTAWTTRVSNPVCSPRFSLSVGATNQKAAFRHR